MAKKKKELTEEEWLTEALVKEEESPYEIPGNWVWVKFGSLAKDMADGPFGSNLKREHYTEKREVRIIQLSNLGEDGWRNKNTKYTTYEHAKTISRCMVKAGEIVIAKMMPAGRAIKAPDLEDAFVLSSDAIKFIPKPMLNIDYLLYGINSTDFRTQISSDTQGITRARTSIGKLKSYAFPLPPLAEQQRIVDRIESLFDKLDQAKDLIQDALDSFETRKAAILHQAFTGQLTKKWREAHGMELESWKETKSESVFEYVTSGSRGWAQYYDTSGSVFIRMGNLDHGTIELDLEDIQYVNLPEMVEGKRSKVEKNDILISITADVGMVGLVRNENMEAYINQHVALVRPVKSVNAEFIAWFLVSDLGLRQLQTLQRGATKIGLTLGDIRNLTIKLPSLSEQTEIVRILDDLFAKEQNAKDLCDLIDQIEAMKKTILGQAFRGELGTNVAGEESAEKLLKNCLSIK